MTLFRSPDGTSFLPIRRRALRPLATALAGCALLFALVSPVWAQSRAARPATLEEAAKKLDLRTWDLLPGAVAPEPRYLANLTYTSKSTPRAAFEFQRKQFQERKWKEAPEPYLSDDYCSATFTSGGFAVSVSVTPGAMPGEVMVSLMQHGNVDLARLPVPKGAKSLYETAVSRAYVTEAPVEETATAVSGMLLKEGWTTYGNAGDVHYFKQNAVRLSARVSTAPAQDNQTLIDYSAQLLSAELPAPPEATRVDYSDTQLSFDTPLEKDQVEAFYRDTLKKLRWTATTDRMVHELVNDFLIFRNPQKDLLQLELQVFEGQSRGLLRFQSAGEVARLEKLANKPKPSKAESPLDERPVVAIAIPATALKVRATADEIEFETAAGKARSVASGWQQDLTRAGWEKVESVLEPLAGAVVLKRDEQLLSIVYTDTGIMPATVTITATGCRLERAAPAKPAAEPSGKPKKTTP